MLNGRPLDARGVFQKVINSLDQTFAADVSVALKAVQTFQVEIDTLEQVTRAPASTELGAVLRDPQFAEALRAEIDVKRKKFAVDSFLVVFKDIFKDVTEVLDAS